MGTIKRPYVLDLIQKYASDCEVEKIGQTKIVELAEEKLLNGKVDVDALVDCVKEWKVHSKLDTVILGCTHFPFLKAELKQILPNVKFFVDSGEAIAKRVKSLIAEKSNFNGEQDAKNQAFCTKLTDDFAEREKILKQWGFESLNVIEI